jgi:hypothetical protein
MSKERPPHIVRAIENEDIAFLSRAGRKGAMVANKHREWRALGMDLAKARTELEYWKGVQAVNLDVVGIDGEDVDAEAVADRILSLELFIETEKDRKTIYQPERKKRVRKKVAQAAIQPAKEEEAHEQLPDSHLLKTQTELPLE